MPASVVTADVDARSGLRRVAGISASLVGTYAVTSVLGLLFWLLAARQLSVSAVGVAGAAVSLMTLLASLGTVGLGTLLIARIPQTPQGSRRVLVRTALSVAGLTATALAVVVPFVAIRLLHVGNLEQVAGAPGVALLFAVGTGLTAVAIVADQAVLVLGNGSLQLERNAVASVVKLLLLLALTLAGQRGGMTVFLAWTLGTLVSLPLVAVRTRGGRALEHGGRLLDLGSMRGLGRAALGHHALNTTLQAPLQLLPLLVVAALSTQANGVFTTALQVSGFVFALPYAISVGLFASAEGDERRILERMRLTIPLGLGISLLANLALFPLAPFVLSVFGAQYSQQGVEVLRILVFAGLPFVVKDHFVALRRVQGRTGQATLVMLAMTAVELLAAYVGVHRGGVGGLCLAWVGVLVLEAAVLLAPPLASSRALRETTTPVSPTSPTSPRPLPVPAPVAPRPLVPQAAAAGDIEGTSSYRARVAAAVGVGPVLLLMTSGLLPVAHAVALARANQDDGRAQAWYVLGLLLMFVPAAIGVLLPGLRSSNRVVLALAMPVLLQLSRVVLYPSRFMFHDELIHAAVLRHIGATGRLFTENSLLPITSYYPGLEIATDSVRDLTGLSAHTSAVVVLLASRVVISLAVLGVVRRLTGSTRVGAAAVVVYACNPQLLFFNSQFSYQSIALPLAAFTVYLVVTRRRGTRTSLVAAGLAMSAVALSHHVTMGLLVAALLVWTVLELGLGRGRQGRSSEAVSLGALTLAGAVLLTATVLNPGNTLGSYLGEIVTSSTTAVARLVSGQQSRRIFQNSAGVATALWEQVLIIASLVLTLLVLLPALYQARRWVSRRVSLAVLLALVALLYPVIPGGHLTVTTAEVGDRAAGFVFLGVAFVVAWWIWARRLRRWQSVTLGAAAGVVFLGSVVLGAGSISQQLPGPFRVSDDARSIDADNLAASRWVDANLPPGSRVYADRVGGLLAGADGGQHPVLHISTGVDASRLLLDPYYGQQDVDLVRRAGIRYLIVDRRDAFGLPNQGVYVESGEFGGDQRTRPVPAAALRKFDAVAGVQRIYDNGSIAVYDLEALRATR